MKIYAQHQNSGAANYLTTSSNGILANDSSGGDLLTWNFGGFTLNSGDAYTFLFSTDPTDNAGSFARLRAAVADNVAGGGFDNISTYSGGQAWDFATQDLRFQANLTYVPEPSSAALLGIGGLALILRRRK